MESLGTGLMWLGFLGFLVSLVALVIALVRKKRKKPWVMSFIPFFILFIVGGGIIQTTRPVGEEIFRIISVLAPLITLIIFVIALVRKRRRLLWFGIFLSSLIVIGLGGWLSGFYFKTEEAEIRAKIDKLEHKIKGEDFNNLITMIKESKTIEYRIIDADANFMKGTPLFYTGKVVQIEKSKNETHIRLQISDDFDEVVYVKYDKLTKEVYKDDTVTVCGELKGYEQYESVAGWTVPLPFIKAKVITQGKKRRKICC